MGAGGGAKEQFLSLFILTYKKTSLVNNRLEKLEGMKRLLLGKKFKQKLKVIAS